MKDTRKALKSVELMAVLSNMSMAWQSDLHWAATKEQHSVALKGGSLVEL